MTIPINIFKTSNISDYDTRIYNNISRLGWLFIAGYSALLIGTALVEYRPTRTISINSIDEIKKNDGDILVNYIEIVSSSFPVYLSSMSLGDAIVDDYESYIKIVVYPLKDTSVDGIRISRPDQIFSNNPDFRTGRLEDVIKYMGGRYQFNCYPTEVYIYTCSSELYNFDYLASVNRYNIPSSFTYPSSNISFWLDFDDVVKNSLPILVEVENERIAYWTVVAGAIGGFFSLMNSIIEYGSSRRVNGLINIHYEQKESSELSRF
jgi:hypothetical protein